MDLTENHVFFICSAISWKVGFPPKRLFTFPM